jgi:DNA-binding winged helix-turn-helix (wHTH) protein
MRYAFADCVLDTQLYTLARAGTTRLLRPKVFQVLVYLLTHRDHVVSREELCTQVWPGQFISETTLESCIKRTRQAIGDSGHTQQLIQTRRGYGYRFIGTVEACPAPPAAASAGVLAPLHPSSPLPQAAHDLVPGSSPQGDIGPR